MQGVPGVSNDVIEAFCWSLGPVMQMLVQTILSGSMFIMKTISMKSWKQFRDADDSPVPLFDRVSRWPSLRRLYSTV